MCYLILMGSLCIKGILRKGGVNRQKQSDIRMSSHWTFSLFQSDQVFFPSYYFSFLFFPISPSLFHLFFSQCSSFIYYPPSLVLSEKIHFPDNTKDTCWYLSAHRPWSDHRWNIKQKPHVSCIWMLFLPPHEIPNHFWHRISGGPAFMNILRSQQRQNWYVVSDW